MFAGKSQPGTSTSGFAALARIPRASTAAPAIAPNCRLDIRIICPAHSARSHDAIRCNPRATTARRQFGTSVGFPRLASGRYGGIGDGSGTGPLGPPVEKPLGPLLAAMQQVADQLTTAIELRWIVEILDIKLDDPDLDLLVALGQYRIRATQIVDLRYEVKLLPERQIAGEFV